MCIRDSGETQEIIKEVAESVDAEWRSRGGRVFFIPVYEEGEGRMRAILTARNVPNNRMTPIDDAAEMMALDSSNRWIRAEHLPQDIAAVASSELGQQFIDSKVEVAVARIRELVQ